MFTEKQIALITLITAVLVTTGFAAPAQAQQMARPGSAVEPSQIQLPAGPSELIVRPFTNVPEHPIVIAPLRPQRPHILPFPVKPGMTVWPRMPQEPTSPVPPTSLQPVPLGE